MTGQLKLRRRTIVVNVGDANTLPTRRLRHGRMTVYRFTHRACALVIR